jgi:hypothetical protein
MTWISRIIKLPAYVSKKKEKANAGVGLAPAPKEKLPVKEKFLNQPKNKYSCEGIIYMNGKVLTTITFHHYSSSNRNAINELNDSLEIKVTKSSKIKR